MPLLVESGWVVEWLGGWFASGGAGAGAAAALVVVVGGEMPPVGGVRLVWLVRLLLGSVAAGNVGAAWIRGVAAMLASWRRRTAHAAKGCSCCYCRFRSPPSPLLLAAAAAVAGCHAWRAVCYAGLKSRRS